MKTNQRSEENRAIPSIELEELKKSFERDKPESLLNHIHMSPESRKLVENNSFALLIAIVADQSVKMEAAWNLPYELGKRIGMERLHPQWITRNSDKVKDAIAQKPALHRFPQKMTDYIFSLSTIIENKYSSAADLLRSSMDYHVFVANVKEVSGISDKKANFLFLTLSLDLHYPFKNTEESSVLFDAHMEKWLSQHFNRTISKKEANEICAYVSPGNPALFCPYIWNKDREIK